CASVRRKRRACSRRRATSCSPRRSTDTSARTTRTTATCSGKPDSTTCRARAPSATQSTASSTSRSSSARAASTRGASHRSCPDSRAVRLAARPCGCSRCRTTDMRPSARSRRSTRWAAVALLAASNGANAQDVTILHHETIPSFGGRTTSTGPAPGVSGKPQASAMPMWSFVAFGRQFDVELEPNDRLLLGLDLEQRARLRDVELYAGRLAGQPGSWVRIARSRGIVSGVIWEGTTLYAVETERRIARFTVNRSAGSGDVAIYRFADMLGVLRDEVIHPSGEDAAPSD